MVDYDEIMTIEALKPSIPIK